MESFTIHGLSKVFVGKFWERLFWGLILLAVLGFLSFKVYGFYTNYAMNEYRTEIRMIDVVNRTWPGIMVCSNTVRYGLSWWKQFEFCYKNHTYLISYESEGKIPCPKPIEYLSAYGWEKGETKKRLNYTKDIISPNSCLRMNISAVHTDTSDTNINVKFVIDGVPIFNLSSEDSLQVYVEGDPVAKYVYFGASTIRVKHVTVIHRLQSPFKSNCTNGNNNLNVFSPPYTRRKCLDTLHFYKMLLSCGDVPDHLQKYVRPHHKKGWDYNGLNRTYENILKCIRDQYFEIHYERHDWGAHASECPLPCHEILTDSEGQQDWVDYMPDIKRSGEAKSIIHLVISSSRITEVHEIATYTLDNFFAEVGSWLGLLVGMSFLSLVEIVAFIYTIIQERCS